MVVIRFRKRIPDQYSTSLTVAEQEICGDLLSSLIQSLQSRPSFTILSEMTDADEMMKSLQLESVQQERDLGVITTSDLKSSSQCLKSAATARKVIGMMRRTFRNLDVSDFRLIYKTYIRPHLEFCIQAWSPHFVKDIQVLENVQKAATN